MADLHRRLLWLGFAAALGLLAVVSWRVLSLGMAAHLSRIDPAAALDWRAGHPEATWRLGDAAAQASGDGAVDPAGIRAAIRAAPLDGRGYRLLGREAEARGNEIEASRMYALATARGPRDLKSHAWLLQQALSRGDAADAVVRIDRMLRVEPQLTTKMTPILVALSLHPAAQDHVAGVLQHDPPWRASFLLYLLREGPDALALSRLMGRLRRTGNGLSGPEAYAWIDRLTRDRQWGAAYLTWVQTLAPDDRERIGNVYNGGFELEPSNAGFDWRFERAPGAQVARAQAPGRQRGLALRVAFENRRVPFQHVKQQLALAPGHYRFEGSVRLDDIRSERGLVWTLSCAEDGRPLGESEPMAGRRDWRQFHFDAAVPGTDCGGQWLTLRVPARIAAEQLIGGVAWFDDLRISAASPRRDGPPPSQRSGIVHAIDAGKAIQ